MWVRGLKRRTITNAFAGISVAPYVGAWIETPPVLQRSGGFIQVAPYVGAWIETHNLRK